MRKGASSQSALPPRSATDITNADIRAVDADMNCLVVRVDGDHILPAG